jgi:phage-related protein
MAPERAKFANAPPPIAHLAEMSVLTYTPPSPDREKVLVWLHGEIKTPPLTPAARLEAGVLLRLLQQGHSLGMPHSRPMPSIGPRTHELRIVDRTRHWRVVYRIDRDAIIIGAVFAKQSVKTPLLVITTCKQRFRRYDVATAE